MSDRWKVVNESAQEKKYSQSDRERGEAQESRSGSGAAGRVPYRAMLHSPLKTHSFGVQRRR